MKNAFLLLFLLSTVLLLGQTPAFDWVGQLGGPNTRNGLGDVGRDVVTDNYGNVFITGVFYDTGDFDPSLNEYSLTSVDASDIFVGKYSADGALRWAISIGGVGDDWGTAITVDTIGNIYVTGKFQAAVDFDPGPGEHIVDGDFDSYILKLDTHGNFVWVKAFLGESISVGTDLIVDYNQNIYTTGSFTNIVDFDPGPNSFSLSSNGGNDIYILKLNAEGDFVWARAIGGDLLDYCSSIALDKFNNIYTTGHFNNTVDFDPGLGEFNLTEIGSDDGDQFILKLNAEGDFVWVKNIGGGQAVSGRDLVVDQQLGYVYTTGFFKLGNVDFDPGPDTSFLLAKGFVDIFVSKYDTDGNYIWAHALGEKMASVTGEGIALDKDYNVYVSGQFSQTIDFDPGIGVHNLSSPISHDAFILKLDHAGSFIWTGSFAGQDYDVCFSVTLDDDNNVYSTGYFQSSIDFDPSPEFYELTAFGNKARTDAFLHKMCQNCGTTSIQDKYNKSSLEYSIYPNPTNCVINIIPSESEDYEFVLFDVWGRPVLISNICYGHVQTSVNLLPSGAYWLRICQNGEMTWKQIMVF